jgi:succinoglycan biosynthesis protein ExoA
MSGIKVAQADRAEADVVPMLSVVVCTHRRPNGLAVLLRSLVPQVAGRPWREIVVVNDGTHDDDYAVVVAEFGNAIRYDALPTPCGIAVARNRTAELARGTFMIFTDDDCVVPPTWLDWVEARLVAHPELDVVGGTTRPHDLEHANFVGRMQAAFDLLPRPYQHEGGMNSFITACLAVRSELFRQLGGFRIDANFASAGEDTDLSFRLARAKSRIRLDPDWWVAHALATSIRSEYRRFYRYGYSNGLLALSHESPRAFAYHLRRVDAGFVRAAWDHFRYNRTRATAVKANPLLKLAYRATDAYIRTGLDRGASAAIRKHRARAAAASR